MKAITKQFRFYLFLLITLGLQSCGPEAYPYVHESERKLKIGDDKEWGEKNYDHSSWDYYPDTIKEEVYWVRMKIKLPEKKDGEYKNLGMMAVGSGAQEVYWDGVFIGTNGRLKTEQEEEISGVYHKYYRLPDSLIQEGEHVLALRATAIQDYQPHHYVYVGGYERLLREPLHMVKYLFMIGGAFLITAIYFFFMYIQEPKEYSILIFGTVCTLFFALILMEYLKYYYDYTYEFQIVRLKIIGCLHMSIALLIPWYFLISFSMPWKKTILSLIVIGIMYNETFYTDSYDYSAWANDQLMWFASILIVGYAAYQRKKGAYIVVAGLAASFLMTYIPLFYNIPFVAPSDISLFVGFVIVLLLMLYLLTRRRKDERKAYEASLVESERLKNELLKKNIKPHFIMNTLTSLIDWVEESPKEGVQFINALAGEFEVLNQIADYKLIPIQQEIKLCKNHLKVMSYRKEVNYIWEEEGIDPNEIIPPAIIHTAVENGVTHNLPDKNGNITFRLIYNKSNVQKEYTLQTFAKSRPAASKEFTKAEGGTGLKYIKSRLQESYGDKWKLSSEAIEGGWETRIIIEQ